MNIGLTFIRHKHDSKFKLQAVMNWPSHLMHAPVHTGMQGPVLFVLYSIYFFIFSFICFANGITFVGSSLLGSQSCYIVVDHLRKLENTS